MHTHTHTHGQNAKFMTDCTCIYECTAHSLTHSLTHSSTSNLFPLLFFGESVRFLITAVCLRVHTYACQYVYVCQSIVAYNNTCALLICIFGISPSNSHEFWNREMSNCNKKNNVNQISHDANDNGISQAHRNVLRA